VLDVLDGYELEPPRGSRRAAARLTDYDPLWLDGLCLSGEIAWGRLTATRMGKPERGQKGWPREEHASRCSGANAARSGERESRSRLDGVAFVDR